MKRHAPAFGVGLPVGKIDDVAVDLSGVGFFVGGNALGHGVLLSFGYYADKMISEINADS